MAERLGITTKGGRRPKVNYFERHICTASLAVSSIFKGGMLNPLQYFNFGFDFSCMIVWMTYPAIILNFFDHFSSVT